MTANGYRLPDEDEWEHATRAGTTTDYSFGDDAADLDDYGWYTDNSDLGEGRRTHPVGLKLPNPWGLYDVHGNVWEWTNTVSGWYRVYRGGSWGNTASYCRSASRRNYDPCVRIRYIGFRVLIVGP